MFLVWFGFGFGLFWFGFGFGLVWFWFGLVWFGLVWLLDKFLSSTCFS